MTYPPQPPYGGQPPAGDPNQPPYGGQPPAGDPNQGSGQPAYGQQPPVSDPNQPAYGQAPADPYQGYGQPPVDPSHGYGQPPPADPYQPGGYGDQTAIYQQQPAPFGSPAGGGYGAPPTPPKSKNGLIFGIAGGVVVIGIIVTLLIVLTGGSKTKQDASSGGQKVASSSSAKAPRAQASGADPAQASGGSDAADPSDGSSDPSDGSTDPSGGAADPSSGGSDCAPPTDSGESSGTEAKNPIMTGLLDIISSTPDVQGTDTNGGATSYWVCWNDMDQDTVVQVMIYLQAAGYVADPDEAAATQTKAFFAESNSGVSPKHIWLNSDGAVTIPSDPTASTGSGSGYFEIDWQDS